MSPDALRDKMQKLADYIYDAEGIVRGGKMVDLSSLDREVALICREATSLPAADVTLVYPTRSDLSAKTRALADFLRDWFAAPPRT